MSYDETLLRQAAMTGAYATTEEAEQHIVIGQDRFITVPEELKRLAVQYDHNIETVTFDCPRYWDGLDMSKMRIYVNYKRSDRVYGSYAATDITVDDVDDSVMHFKWRITKNVSLAAGQIEFLVCIKQVDSEGTEELHWNSERCEDCYISEGMEWGEQIAETYPDIVSQLELENRERAQIVIDELLADRNAGRFNPIIDVTAIAGGHLITITSGPNIKEFEVLDGNTDSIRAYLNSCVSISNTKPVAGPAFWFDNTNQPDASMGIFKFMKSDGSIVTIYPVVKLSEDIGSKEVVNHIKDKNNPHGVTPSQIGAAVNKAYITTGTGSAYLVDIPGITSLEAGMSFVIIPHVASTTDLPTLNINNLGVKGLRRGAAYTSGSTFGGYSTDWLVANKPVRITYDGTNWCVDSMPKYKAEDLVGITPVGNGGTGKDKWTANRMIYASGETTFAQTEAPTEEGSILMQDPTGAPYWSSIPNLGACRIKTGSYEGTGANRTLDLGCTPILLIVYDESVDEQNSVAKVFKKINHFIQGMKINDPDSDGDENSVTLSGSNLVFYYAGDSSHITHPLNDVTPNKPGSAIPSVYTWIAFY